MAQKSKQKQPAQKAGVMGALTRKIGPLPFWAWALIGGALLYWYRSRTASSAAASTAASPTTLADGGSGSAGGDTGSGSGGGGGSSPPGDTTTGTGDSGVLPGYSPFPRLVGTTGAVPSSSPGSSPTAAQSPSFLKPTAAADPNFAADAAARSAAAIAAGVAPRFGGVTSTQTLKSGATLTTFGSGREVEQAPGKSAFVVAAGSSGIASKTVSRTPTPTAPRRSPTPAPKPTKNAYSSNKTKANIH